MDLRCVLEDEISSAVLLQKLDLDEITAVLRTQRLRWYGHVQRATSCINSITRLGLPSTIEIVGGQGRRGPHV